MITARIKAGRVVHVIICRIVALFTWIPREGRNCVFDYVTFFIRDQEGKASRCGITLEYNLTEIFLYVRNEKMTFSGSGLQDFFRTAHY